MTGDLPGAWSHDRTDVYKPTPDATTRRFFTYVHDSGDVSLRIAPTTLEVTERPGYELVVTSYPGLELERRDVVRTVTTATSCDRLAREFMSLFEGVYDGPGDLETAVAYATEHVQPSAANDAIVVDE
ncbi:hypothetical protein [Natrialbaceae archaeon AArc-T1-2]|uniref:hypothetical protein n=1 Tax=Natrialbaceae archaeon AArc-T1-2 TaxID=3053904 RepID=UPI00255AA6F7|nr:hypothetical protein [Natrialbaceae archaeon AArc-T1-2]WIV65848.1 hypothetical protein QQ977_09055 [Natrialbaceae archaeon AArc-T1-2]